MVKRPGLEAIEKHFKMPFEKIIKVLHWDKKKSVNFLSIECGISRDTFQKNAKRLGLKLRPITESNKYTPNKGEKHWTYGLRKETSAWAKMHSERMKKNNPVYKKSSREKFAKTMANTFRKNPLKQEKEFSKILDKLKIEYLFQYPIGGYIIDFFIERLTLCIEIDSTYKWGKDRKNAAKIRDKYLNGKGFKVLRINKAHLKKEDLILDILKTNNVIIHS